MSNERFEVEGTVVDIKRNIFVVEVKLNKGEPTRINCTLSGKLRKNYIKILKGDHVTIDLSTADPTKGRIIWRDK